MAMTADSTALAIDPTPVVSTQVHGRNSKIKTTFIRLFLHGAVRQWGQVFSPKGAHLWCEMLVPASLCIPIAYAIAHLIYHEKINGWNNQPWRFTSSTVAFLLSRKLKIAFDRWWEARGHMGTASKCCRSMMILVSTRLTEGHDTAYECADDVRRYAMLYYWLMCFQLLNMDLKQDVVMHHLKGRPEEDAMLFRPERKNNHALAPLAWLSTRINDLANATTEEYGSSCLTPHELQEAIDHVDEMVTAFEGATKIKNTIIPTKLEHLCTLISYVYVYLLPLPMATVFSSSPGVSYNQVAVRTMIATLWVSMSVFGLFEIGNELADPFGDDEADLGSTMMAMGNELEDDLTEILTARVPASQLRISHRSSMPVLGPRSRSSWQTTSSKRTTSSKSSKSSNAPDVDAEDPSAEVAALEVEAAQLKVEIEAERLAELSGLQRKRRKKSDGV